MTLADFVHDTTSAIKERVVPGTDSKELEISEAQKEALEKARLDTDIAKILEAAKPPGTDRNYLELETAKAVMEKVTQDKTLPSTTNVNRTERWELIKLRVAYHYSGNPVLLIIADSHMKLNRSLTNEPTNVLSGLFMLPKMVEEEAKGRWGKFKQWAGGRG